MTWYAAAALVRKYGSKPASKPCNCTYIPLSDSLAALLSAVPRRVGDGILALITQLGKWYDSEVHLVNAPPELSTHQVETKIQCATI